MSGYPLPSPEIENMRASAQRLGIELNEAEAQEWLAAIAAIRAESSAEIQVDADSRIYGHKVAMLDFSPQELDRFRRIGEIVGFRDQPGVVESALALSGSSAQSKFQTYPGDCDFFERVNILAPSRERACQILSEIMRAKALDTWRGPGYQLIEVKFGSLPFPAILGDRVMKTGAPLSWTPEQIQAGFIPAQRPDGTPVQLTWEMAANDPGWCKLDWVVVDQQRSQLANASNMLDVTWEAPDGALTPLDGYLDPYYQEVYLEVESIPIFSKLAGSVSSDALDHYVGQLEKEVRKYIQDSPANYGKAAKRMYNIFRLNGMYKEAAFLRELFDEPAALLYQVWSLIRTIDDSTRPGSNITQADLVAQTDHLIMAVIRALEGDQEEAIVRQLLRLRDSLAEPAQDGALSAQAEAARAEVIQLVNNFFYEKLTSIPEISDYIACLQQ